MTRHAAILTAQARLLPEQGAGRIQLLPLGDFAARDGRPGTLAGSRVASWKCDVPLAQALIARWRARKTPLVVDYEHQTQLAAKNGQPAPAAGWITDLVLTEGGLYAAVEWTERARAYIRSGEYRYISPALAFDPDTGAVLELKSAALTNFPALDGMDVVQARTGVSPEESMLKELSQLLRKKLSLAEDATDDVVAAALEALGEKSLSETLAEKDAAIAALKNADPDPTRYVPQALLAAEQQKTATLAARVEELETGRAADGLTAEVQAALKDGRLPKSCEGWAMRTAKIAPDSLRAYLDAAVSVAALTAMQTTGKDPDGGKTALLTEEEKYACAQTGVSEADYLAQKAKENN